MMRVLKHPLDLRSPRVTIQGQWATGVNEGVFVGNQDGVLTLWAVEQQHAPMKRRVFEVYGTGHIVPDNTRYIGSAICGPFVWHVFEHL